MGHIRWCAKPTWMPLLAPRNRAGAGLGNDFTLVAANSVDAGIFGGISGAPTRLLVLRTRSGNRIAIHPKLPPMRVRRTHAWLGNTRFFLRAVPAGEAVMSVAGFDASGRVLYRLQAQEGGFEGVN